MLPLKVKFNLSSFIIAHKDGSRETFDSSLADAYASLKDGDIVAYSNLGKPYQDTPFMSWVPVIIDADNLHDARPVIRQLSKEHALAVGRLSSKQVVLAFPLNRNFPVAGSDRLDYMMVYQALLSYYAGVVKTTAKDAGVELKVHRMPFLTTPASETVNPVQEALRFTKANASLKEELGKAKHVNDTKRVAELKKALSTSTIPTSPKMNPFQMMDRFMSHGDYNRTLIVSKAIHYSCLTRSFVSNFNHNLNYANAVNSEVEHLLFSLVKAVYLHYQKDTKEAENTLRDMGKTVERMNPYDGSWDTSFEELVQEPYQVYGLKQEWSLKFHDSKTWIVPTETLMKMIRADISDIKKPNIRMITVGKKDEKKRPKAEMVSNYQLEIVNPRICGHSLAYNRVSKQIEFLHAIDTQYVHARYEKRDDDGTVTDVDRNRAFPLDDKVIGQIETGLEQVEGNVISQHGMLKAITAVAQQNSYDPVSSYIDSLPAGTAKNA